MQALALFSVQFMLAVTWTLYTAFLPALAAQAGLPAAQVAWILLMDQAIFVVMDSLLGIAADRVADALHRVGTWILAASVVSAVAFALLAKSASPQMMLFLTVCWAATSSALRAPPMVIIARRLRESAPRFLVGCSMLGVGVASALAPLLTAWMRGQAPALPFLLASLGLLAAVLALQWVEAHAGPLPVAASATVRAGGMAMAWLLLAAVFLLAFGFQVHSSVNSAPAYLRFVKPGELVRVMPAFWIGFAMGVLLPARLPRGRFLHHGALTAAATLGALVLAGIAHAPSLTVLLAAQCAVGLLWGVVFCAAAGAAIDAGHVGREGRLTGILFALAALAACVRIAMVASGVARQPALAGLLPWLPSIAWGTAGVLLAAFVLRNMAVLAARPARGDA
ncbi:MFS transporter [Cupriavidus pinatubonensis]|uniref:MFS transporter n=1 Tax=Cupriavidus pinatubonensis TaxID=248026 RepID=UPI001127C11D|nr:MFS transporter [Cupriavidus pinatubonensis]QYY29075.1 MFS transporter [Cupriavidus pinatubonensis]TPQ37859.1 MFS transporter [Cupriavidus pinatubonensis]